MLLCRVGVSSDHKDVAGGGSGKCFFALLGLAITCSIYIYIFMYIYMYIYIGIYNSLSLSIHI